MNKTVNEISFKKKERNEITINCKVTKKIKQEQKQNNNKKPNTVWKSLVNFYLYTGIMCWFEFIVFFFLVGANMKLSRIHKKSSENEINCVSHTITLVSCHCLSARFPEVIFFTGYTYMLCFFVKECLMENLWQIFARS